MKSHSRSGRPAFTLIELMAVITIIVILAGLVIGGMGYVTDKQAREKAKVQIALLSKGLEDYKLDMGAYPASADSADGLGSTKTVNIPVRAPGATADSTLFALLYKDGVTNKTTIYIPDLDYYAGRQGWILSAASTVIVDPWGSPYRYRSAFAAPAGTPPVANPNSSTFNPDFDLWSGGKDAASVPATPADSKNRDDIKNF